jgi:hypothetical protein
LCSAQQQKTAGDVSTLERQQQLLATTAVLQQSSYGSCCPNMWLHAMLKHQLRAPAVQLLTMPGHAGTHEELLGKLLVYSWCPAG